MEGTVVTYRVNLSFEVAGEVVLECVAMTDIAGDYAAAGPDEIV